MEDAVHDVETPLRAWSTGSTGRSRFGIMPIFALANAGVAFGARSRCCADPVALGIVLGLVVGKPRRRDGAGVRGRQEGLATLPAGVTWRHVFGARFLTGIGFTMSIFIATLAFGRARVLDSAKVGILVASVVSGVLGAIMLLRLPPTAAGDA